MKKIESQKAPKAIGPYSQAMQTGNLVYLSGQLGIDRESGEMAKTVEEQVHQVFKNIQFVLAELDLDLSNVVKTLVLMKDIKDFAAVNEVYAQYFSEPYPARSAFAVDALPSEALVEIEIIAELNN